MTTTTKSRRPVVIAPEVAPDRPAVSVRPRQQGQYIALNGVAMVIIAAVALTLIGILYLMQTAKVAGLGYQFSRLQNDYYSLSLENSKLGYQVARDQSLDQVQQIAVKQLGMTPLTHFEFLQVQRPPSDNLPPIPSDAPPRPSLWQRMRAALSGESSVAPVQRSSTVAPPASAGSSNEDVATNATSPAVPTPESTVGAAP